MRGLGVLYVADGIYPEAVFLINGISLKGGYQPGDWMRHLDSTGTIIMGDGYNSVIASGIDSPTILEGFVIRGVNQAGVGVNSYGIRIRDCNAGLSIRNNIIWAGAGGDGLRGADGTGGSDGTAGDAGMEVLDLHLEYGIVGHACDSSLHSPGGAGGKKFCGNIETSGGAGGERICPAWDSGTNTTIGPTATEYGEAGLNSGGGGGAAGWDVYHQIYQCDGFSRYGLLMGQNGQDGPNGQNGISGQGCSDGFGHVVDGY
jgi:hypothetical protein